MLYPSVLTAERAPLDTLLLKSLDSTLEGIWKTRRGKKPQVLNSVKRYLNGSAPALSRCATSDVVSCFEEAVQTIAEKTGSGLLLIVDEAGKALEYAAQQPTRGDVYLLQALAEAAARSNGVPFVILTVLHQSFDQYAHQLGSSDRNEWTKVQGRFGELAFREGGDQIIRLTASAIRRTGRLQAPKGLDAGCLIHRCLGCGGNRLEQVAIGQVSARPAGRSIQSRRLCSDRCFAAGLPRTSGRCSHSCLPASRSASATFYECMDRERPLHG